MLYAFTNIANIGVEANAISDICREHNTKIYIVDLFVILVPAHYFYLLSDPQYVLAFDTSWRQRALSYEISSQFSARRVRGSFFTSSLHRYLGVPAGQRPLGRPV